MALLDLQDRKGGDVMRVLWAAAAAAAGRRLRPPDLARFDRATQAARAMARRRRAHRRRLKRGGDAAAYAAAKASELAAEHAVACRAPDPVRAGRPAARTLATLAMNLGAAAPELSGAAAGRLAEVLSPGAPGR